MTDRDSSSKEEPVLVEAVPGGSSPAKLDQFKKMNEKGRDLWPYLSENK